MRLFAAVDPSPEAVAHLLDAVGGLPTGVARAKPELWHVTLAFLGEVADAAVPGVEAAVARAAAEARPATLRVAGAGRFGDAVLWAGIDGDLDALHDLAKTLRTELTAIGVTFDGRPYTPHLTLGRVGRSEPAAGLHADVDVLAGYTGPDWPLDQVHLMRSWFGVSDRYELIRTWPIGAPSRT